jgi:hypothetical protein
MGEADRRLELADLCFLPRRVETFPMPRVILAMLAVFSIAECATGRIWTDSTGSRHTEAEILSFDDTSVLLRKPDGTAVRIEFDKLSRDDLEFLRKHAHDHPPAEGVPKGLKTDAEKAADQINSILKRVGIEIDKVAAQDTAVRINTTYANALRDINNEVKAKTLEVRLTIKNVADDNGHTLTLGSPVGIQGTSSQLTSFNPKYSTAQAVQINAGDLLVLRGHGRLIYNYQQPILYHQLSPATKTLCVLSFYNKKSNQFYGLQLVDYSFHIERRSADNAAPPVNQNAPAVAAQPPKLPEKPKENSPQPPGFALVPREQSPNLAVPPNGNLSPPSSWPQASPPVQPTSPAPPANVYGPPSGVTGSPTIAAQPKKPLSRIDINVSYAKYVKSKLTPDKFDQRAKRQIAHFTEFTVWRSMPTMDIGHNYDSVLWRSLHYWPNDRLALWLHHNVDNIGFDFWKELAGKSGVRDELDKLKKQGVAVDPNYIDEEFVDDPDLMYRDEFVAAIYNSGFDYASDWTMPWTTLVAVCVFGAILLLAWTKYEGYF